MFPLIKKVADRLLKDLKENEGKEIELKENYGKVSMDTIASCVFGVEAESFDNPKSEFVKEAKNALTISTVQMLKFMGLLAGALPLYRYHLKLK